jgi:undecaprenyl-diphosphatase
MPVLRRAIQLLKTLEATSSRLFTWIGGHELSVLLAIFAVAGGVWLFGVIADEVLEGGTQSFDRSLLLAVRSMRPPLIRSYLMDEYVRDITALGGPVVLTLLTLTAGGFLVLTGKKRMAYFLCASVLGGALLSWILKDAFQRPRPDLLPYLAETARTSFPSGHSMMSSLTYFTLGALLARAQNRLTLKAYVMLVAVFLTLIVGLSRIYLGLHWPTDVLAGWMAGASWAASCWLLARWLQRQRALET